MSNWKPTGLATGIGSLPLTDPVPALQTILQNLPHIPHWPQLALPGEQLVAQYLNPLINLGLVLQPKQGAPYFDPEQGDWLDKQTTFYSYFLEQEATGIVPEVFAFPKEAAKGFYHFLTAMQQDPGNAQYLKGQVTGPVTMGMQVSDAAKRPAYYNPELRDLLVKTLSMHAAWQAQQLQKAGLPAIIFIDEPGLYGYGASTHITLKHTEIVAELNEIITALHHVGALAGIHVCANTDWGMVLDTQLDVLSFDAYQYFSSLALYGNNLKAFINRGGILAWGIVPTSEAIKTEDAASLKIRFLAQLDTLVAKGMDRKALLQQSLITPSCGVGSLPFELAAKIYHVTGELATSLAKDM